MQTLRVRAALLVLLTLLLTALVACSSGDDDDDSDDGDTAAATEQSSNNGDDDGSGEDDDDNDGGGGNPFSGPSGSGTFTVDGEELQAEIVVSCEPFDAGAFGGEDANEDNLDINATDNHGTFIEVEVAYREVSAFTSDDSYTAVYLNPFLTRTGDGGTEQYDGSAVSDPEGNWYTNLIPEFVIEGQEPDGELLPPPAGIERNGNNIRGALTLTQSWPAGASGTVDVTFDLDFPSEVIDCSLR